MFTDAAGQLQPGIKKVSYTHAACIDIILAHPAINQRQLALHFGYTEGWISQILASDAFQAALADRKNEIVDPMLRGQVEESIKGLVLQSMMKLREKLEASPSDDLALEVFKNSTRALGYGARLEVRGNINHNHSHSLVGVISSLPPASRVLDQAPGPQAAALPAPA